jgi:hypothetical protein
MVKKKKQEKPKSPKLEGLPREKYAPIEEWGEAEERYKDWPLNNGEFTKIIDRTTGEGICIVAKFNNSYRSHEYLNGGIEIKTNLIEITPQEINERKKEQEKFL